MSCVACVIDHHRKNRRRPDGGLYAALPDAQKLRWHEERYADLLDLLESARQADEEARAGRFLSDDQARDYWRAVTDANHAEAEIMGKWRAKP